MRSSHGCRCDVCPRYHRRATRCCDRCTRTCTYGKRLRRRAERTRTHAVATNGIGLALRAGATLLKTVRKHPELVPPLVSFLSTFKTTALALMRVISKGLTPMSQYPRPTEAAMAAAAKWWADKLRGDITQDASLDDGQPLGLNIAAKITLITNMARQAARDDGQFSPAQITRFEEQLVRALRVGGPRSYQLHTDYDPWYLLREVATEVLGSDLTGAFPFRTTMELRGDFVRVREGATGTWVTIHGTVDPVASAPAAQPDKDAP